MRSVDHNHRRIQLRKAEAGKVAAGAAISSHHNHYSVNAHGHSMWFVVVEGEEGEVI